MRKLSNLFMYLSLFCFAVPAFAQGGEASGGVNWVAIAAGFSMAFASGICALAQGKATAASGRRLGTESCCPTRNSAGADSRSGADRIPGAVYPGHYFCQGEVERLGSLRPLRIEAGASFLMCSGEVRNEIHCRGLPTLALNHFGGIVQ